MKRAGDPITFVCLALRECAVKQSGTRFLLNFKPAHETKMEKTNLKSSTISWKSLGQIFNVRVIMNIFLVVVGCIN